MSGFTESVVEDAYRYRVGREWPFVAKITRNAGYSGRRWMRLDAPELYSAFCTCSPRAVLSH